MFYLYSVQKYSDVWDEIPEEQREWWWLVMSSESKQILLDWYEKYRYASSHSFKLVQVQGSLPDFFYPSKEIKRRTNAGKLLKSINWKKDV
jgi:hypothetical protein